MTPLSIPSPYWSSRIFPLPFHTSPFLPLPKPPSPAGFYLLRQAITYFFVHPFSRYGLLNHLHPTIMSSVVCMQLGSMHGEGSPHNCIGCCQLLHVMRRHPSNAIKKQKKTSSLERGSTTWIQLRSDSKTMKEDSISQIRTLVKISEIFSCKLIISYFFLLCLCISKTRIFHII